MGWNLFNRRKTNAQAQNNSAKAGNIKNSTINLEIPEGLNFGQALLLNKLESIDKRLDKLEKNQNKIHARGKKNSRALDHYVSNNGVSQEVKDEVKRILK